MKTPDDNRNNKGAPGTWVVLAERKATIMLFLFFLLFGPPFSNLAKSTTRFFLFLSATLASARIRFSSPLRIYPSFPLLSVILPCRAQQFAL